MARRLIGCILAGLLMLTANLAGQDDPKKAGPLKSIPQGFRAFVVIDDRFDVKETRNRAGKPHCFVCEHGLAPAVAVFVRTVPTDADAPLFQLLRSLDDAAKKYKADRFGAYCIFLTLNQLYEDDLARELKVAEVAKVGKQAKVDQVPMAIAEATTPDQDKAIVSPQVEAFQIAPGDDVTVIFYNRFQILNRWTFAKDQAITDADVKAIRAEIDKLLAPKARIPRGKVVEK